MVIAALISNTRNIVNQHTARSIIRKMVEIMELIAVITVMTATTEAMMAIMTMTPITEMMVTTKKIMAITRAEDGKTYFSKQSSA